MNILICQEKSLRCHTGCPTGHPALGLIMLHQIGIDLGKNLILVRIHPIIRQKHGDVVIFFVIRNHINQGSGIRRSQGYRIDSDITDTLGLRHIFHQGHHRNSGCGRFVDFPFQAFLRIGHQNNTIHAAGNTFVHQITHGLLALRRPGQHLHIGILGIGLFLGVLVDVLPIGRIGIVHNQGIVLAIGGDVFLPIDTYPVQNRMVGNICGDGHQNQDDHSKKHRIAHFLI